MNEAANGRKPGSLAASSRSLPKKQPPGQHSTRPHANRPSSFSNNVGDALYRGTSLLARLASAARDSFAEDLSICVPTWPGCRKPCPSSQVKPAALPTRTVRNVGRAVGSEVGSTAKLDCGCWLLMVSSAKLQVKTFASGFEAGRGSIRLPVGREPARRSDHRHDVAMLPVTLCGLAYKMTRIGSPPGAMTSGRSRKRRFRMSLGTIILIILVIALLGGFSGLGGGPFYGTGYYGGGGLGLVIVILLILILLGKI